MVGPACPRYQGVIFTVELLGDDVGRSPLRSVPSALVTVLVLPIVAREFFSSDTGREYGVGLLTKLRLLFIFIRNNVRVVSASNFLYHLIMAGKILRIPKDLPGDLIECGSYEGGAYAGSLTEVRENIRKYGVLDVCEFHVGYFSDTLPGFSEQLVFAYIDADLTDSVRDCLRYVWPLLQPDCFLFTDEAHHTQIAGLFYDPGWWEKELNAEPPGLVGGGNGLGLLLHPGGFRSSLGFTVKLEKLELPRRAG